MNATNILRNPRLLTLTAAVVVGAAGTFFTSNPALAAGETGTTVDRNIGVGELQECTISKSMDMASTKLTQFAINGNSASTGDRLGNFQIQVATSEMQN